jgi:hypothetical protein
MTRNEMGSLHKVFHFKGGKIQFAVKNTYEFTEKFAHHFAGTFPFKMNKT